MTELVYGPREAAGDILKKWPQAKIDWDASDFIHDERFEVEVDVPLIDFYLFALEKGFLFNCFMFQLHNRLPKEKIPAEFLEVFVKIEEYVRQRGKSA